MFKIAKEFSFDMAHMLNGHDGKMNLLETITQLGQLNLRANKPKWQLSLQTHKIIGIEKYLINIFLRRIRRFFSDLLFYFLQKLKNIAIYSVFS